MTKQKRKVKSNGWTVVGQISSLKGNCIQFESSLEEGFVYFLVFDSEVESIDSQPVEIKYLDEGGKQRSYTPDFLVKYRNRPTGLFEVKPQETVDKNEADFQRIKAAGEMYAREKSWTYAVVTDQQIKTNYGDNVRFLFRFERYTVDLSHASAVVNVLLRIGKSTVTDLLDALTDDSELALEYLAVIWALIFNKKIACNLFEKLTMTSLVWICQDNFNELKYPYKL